MSIEAFWASADDERAPAPQGPPWVTALWTAARAENRFDLDAADDALAQIVAEISAPWSEVAELVRLRIGVRRARASSLHAHAGALRALLSSAEPATRARAAHLLGVCCTRLARLAEAQEVLVSALDDADAITRVRVLDSIATTWQFDGAWEEARRTLEEVAREKSALGDAIGTAITAGSRARLELYRAQPARALAIVAGALDPSLPAMTSVRLETIALEAALAAEDAELRRSFAARLGARMHEGTRHDLYGHAAIALARAADAEGHAAVRDRWLALADEHFELPAQRALCAVLRARFASERPAGWLERVLAILPREGVARAEIDARLLEAEEHHARGDREGARIALAEAARRARAASNVAWAEEVDAAADRIDPEGRADRIARRFAGRPIAELAVTRRALVTIVFVDLVGFTPRSRSLSPEEVMATARSLFELAAPLLARHRVQPLAYLGDGLLGVAEGEGHERRAIELARALIARTKIASRVRAALGQPWGLDVRAGIATGEVVLGLLGSYAKQEFTAIGLTTNLAARLQAQAAEREIVCALETARAAGVGDAHEMLELKGFDTKVAAVRLALHRQQ